MSESALLDALTHHRIGLERYSASLVEKIQKHLRAVERDLQKEIASRVSKMDAGEVSTKRMRSLLAAIKEINQEGHKALRPDLFDGLHQAARYEAEWTAEAYSRAFSLRVTMQTPSAPMLRSIVTTQPFQGRFLKDWASGLESGTLDRIQQQILIGMTEGEGTDDIIRRLRGTRAGGFKDGVFATNRRSVEMVTRTAVNHVSNAAHATTLEENKHLFPHYRWISVLDGRTSPICRERSGKVYKTGEGPVPPGHPNCRSTIVGVPRGSSTEQRKELDYAEWLEQQPSDVQREILGPTRYQLYKDGGIKIDKFVADGQMVTLDRLKQLDEAAFKRAGLLPKPKPAAPTSPRKRFFGDVEAHLPPDVMARIRADLSSSNLFINDEWNAVYDAQGISQDTRKEFNKILHQHGIGGGAQEWAEDQMVAALADPDSELARLIKTHSRLEEEAIREWAAAAPQRRKTEAQALIREFEREGVYWGDTRGNPYMSREELEERGIKTGADLIRELRPDLLSEEPAKITIYRGGSKGQKVVEPWTQNPEGADVGSGIRIKPDHQIDLIKALDDEDYAIVGGISRMTGAPGESEVTLINLRRLEGEVERVTPRVMREKEIDRMDASAVLIELGRRPEHERRIHSRELLEDVAGSVRAEAERRGIHTRAGNTELSEASISVEVIQEGKVSPTTTLDYANHLAAPVSQHPDVVKMQGNIDNLIEMREKVPEESKAKVDDLINQETSRLGERMEAVKADQIAFFETVSSESFTAQVNHRVEEHTAELARADLKAVERKRSERGDGERPWAPVSSEEAVSIYESLAVSPDTANDLQDYESGRALLRYTSSDYRRINGFMRDPIGDANGATQTVKLVDDMERLFEHPGARLRNDVALYRGVKNAEAAFGTADLSSLAGTTIKDPAFLSTTMDSAIADDFFYRDGQKGARYTIRARDGQKAIGGTYREREIILPSNTALRILKVEDNDSHWLIEAEIVDE